MRDPQLTAELAAHANTIFLTRLAAPENAARLQKIEAGEISRLVLLARTTSSRTLAGNLRSAAPGNSAGLRASRARNAKRFAASAGIYPAACSRDACARLAPAPHRGIDLLEVRARFWLDAIRQCRSGDARRFLHACLRRSFAAGTDDLVDFNCLSAQEQGTCTFSNCGFNLLNFKESALERRAHDKLAHRPFNRLLLSSKHP